MRKCEGVANHVARKCENVANYVVLKSETVANHVVPKCERVADNDVNVGSELCCAFRSTFSMKGAI